MATIKINSAYSAQPSTGRPNPFVEVAIEWIKSNTDQRSTDLDIGDQGCGKLRHFPILNHHFRKIWLIDSEFQLTRAQKIFDVDSTTIPEYIKGLKQDNRYKAVSSSDFQRSRLQLDVIFNICVLDVETPPTRKAIMVSAARNLRKNGLLVLIVPRNDQSILVRCNRDNSTYDGHAFNHNGVITFYKNFRSTTALLSLIKQVGLQVIADLSVYRQICFICKK